MKSADEKFLKSPGIAKRCRMQVCLHETSHALAFQKLCGVRACAIVYLQNNGGLCTYSRVPDRQLHCEAVAIAAGIAGEHLITITGIPPGRYRKIRAARRHSARWSDSKKLALFAAYSKAESLPTIDGGMIEIEAWNFVRAHSEEIIRLALRLYRDGRLYLPARPAEGFYYGWSR